MTAIVRIAIAASSLMAASDGLAQPSTLAYVDEIAIYGDIDMVSAREHVERSLTSTGHTVMFASTERDPCGNVVRCLSERGRSSGAQLGVRVTMLHMGGETSVAWLIVDVTSQQVRKYATRAIDVQDADAGLAGAMAMSDTPAEQRTRPRRRRIAAWASTAAGVAMAGVGTWALIRAHSLKSDFLARHTDASGHVVGISPADAEREETRARRWSLAGGMLLAGAGVAGVTATLLFIDQPGDGPRPAGLTVAGTF